MKNAAVICEFDPLHTGHEYLIKSLRDMGAENIVCIMSANACQRGELAVFSKAVRAKAALLCSADLVLELPFPYCSASAEYFAFGAMSVIEALGCIDTLCFGCESGNAKELCEAAEVLLSPEFKAEYEKTREKHKSLGAAEQISIAFSSLGYDSTLLLGANNTLAIEYIKAAKSKGLSLKYTAVKRIGAEHGEGETEGFASASFIREKLSSGELKTEYLPASARELFGRAVEQGDFSLGLSKIGDAVLTHFRLLDKEAPETAEASGGLINRMIDASHKATGYNEFLKLIKTKKYTDARLRRAIIFSLTGTMTADLKEKPQYITLLGATKKGIGLLAKVKKALGLPLISNPSMLSTLPKKANRQRLLSHRIEAIRTLTKKEKAKTEDESKLPPAIL